jgi:hypothetical protein
MKKDEDKDDAEEDEEEDIEAAIKKELSEAKDKKKKNDRPIASVMMDVQCGPLPNPDVYKASIADTDTCTRFLNGYSYILSVKATVGSHRYSERALRIRAEA